MNILVCGDSHTGVFRYSNTKQSKYKFNVCEVGGLIPPRQLSFSKFLTNATVSHSATTPLDCPIRPNLIKILCINEYWTITTIQAAWFWIVWEYNNYMM